MELDTKHTHTHRNCLGCSFKTIERKQFRNENKRNCYQTTSIGLTCSVCKGLLCKNCIKDLHTKLNPYRRLLHADNDAFVAAIDAYMNIGGNKQHALEDFVGHCCIINQHFEKQPTATATATATHKSEQSKQPAPKQDFRYNIAAQQPNKASFRTRQQNRRMQHSRN